MADAKVLLETALRSNTSSIYFLLENVKHGQILREKSAACEWVTTSNKLLNSHKNRWMGICLLDCLVEQCETDLFNDNCLSWLKTLLQIIQQEKQNLNMCKYAEDVMEKIFSFSVQFSEISRQISLTFIPPLITSVLSDKKMFLEVSMLVIKACVQHYPAASGSFVKRIENHILQVFDTDEYFLIQVACRCFAILPKCGSNSGTGLDKQIASWEIQWNKILNTLSAVVEEFYNHRETGSAYEGNSETLQLKSIPVVEPQRTDTCVLRIKCMLKCLELMLRNNFSKSVNIPFDGTMKVIEGLLAVNEKSIKNNVSLESVLLKSSIPSVHVSALEFFSTLILSCGMNLLPYHHLITQMLLSELSWSECNDKVNGLQQKYSQLRSAVYHCVQHLIHVTSCVGENTEKILRHVIEDIRPRITTTKLLAPTVSTSKTPSHGKKAKRKRLQDDINQLNRTEEKTDYHANRDLCFSGLQALNSIILKGGNDISSGILKEVQVLVVSVLLQCQQVSTLQRNHPIPYGAPDCRKMLYNLLQSLLYNHNPTFPPPLQHAIAIFSQGAQDQDLEVSKFCTEAQMLCHILIHPRVAVVSSGVTLSQEQEFSEKQSNVTVRHIHKTDFPGIIEVDVDTDKAQPLSNGRIDSNFVDGNGGSILGKRTGTMHDSSALVNFSDGLHSSSNKSVPNTDNKDTMELTKESQHDDTLKSTLRESQQSNTELMSVVVEDNENADRVHEQIEQNIAENRDNIKRSLPEGCEDRDVLTVVIDDSAPVKRRKLQDLTASSKLEDGVSNKNDKNEESLTSLNTEKLDWSGEDETLVKEMINSFVDSIPD